MEEDDGFFSMEAPEDLCLPNPKTLTIRTSADNSNVTSISPSISPPSAAFFSALQSPYISPRAFLPPPPVSAAGSTTTTATSSDDLPSTSLTPPSESYDEAAPPRLSFSFPVPRVSFSKASLSPSCNAKLRSCDVFIGYHTPNPNPNPNIPRFTKWLRSELELHGIAAFVADRGKSSDIQSREIADRIICAAHFGVVIVSASTFLDPFAVEEIRFFSQKKNLVPLWFDCDLKDVPITENKQQREELLEALTKANDPKLRAEESNWRTCIQRAVTLLGLKLGRKTTGFYSSELSSELPFLRSKTFVGREKELAEMESLFFEREGALQRSKQRRVKVNGGGKVHVGGEAGMGKTELALEFAYRFSQRYKTVLWVNGEAKYLRQNFLSLAKKLEVDVSADGDRERGKFKSFEEQESEAFQRLKKEIFREIPYLLIIDNLESEKDNLSDLIPKNTGATHVIVTSRLQRVMNTEVVLLQPLAMAETLTLTNMEAEREIHRKFWERLGGLTFGLTLVGSLLTFLGFSPSELLEAIDRMSLSDEVNEDRNPFLTKVLIFCMAAIDRKGGLSSRMILAGAWFAPSPISATQLKFAVDEQNPNSCCYSPRLSKALHRGSELEVALMAVKLGLARRSTTQPGLWIQLHSITRSFAARRRNFEAPPLMKVLRREKEMSWEHIWAALYLVFGYKTEPPLVLLSATEMTMFIKKVAMPAAIRAFVSFSRCSSAMEILKCCTGALEEEEKRFVARAQGWCSSSSSSSGGSWRKGKLQREEEAVWKEVTMLKASVLEMRAKLMMRGGYFDGGEELCRTCISIRTVMLGHGHALTLAAQETLARLVRVRSKV